MVPKAKDVQSLLREWKEKLLKEEQNGEISLGGDIIAGPRDLVIREILVDRYLRSNIPDLEKKARPTTVFLWELGEGPEECGRRGTKIGGTPWWPADRAWPGDSKGVPLRFVAQIDFCVQHPLKIKLPGELLSIFIAESEDYLWGPFEFFWHTPSPDTEMLKANHVPEPISKDYIFGPFFGHPYLTYDYELYDWRSPEECLARLIDQAEERDLLEGIFSTTYGAERIVHMQATKIGGVPHFINSFMPGSKYCQWKLNWMFLCTMSSAWAPEGESFSGGKSVNQHTQPLAADTDLEFGDAGQMYVFLDESDAVKYWVDCY